LPGTVFQFGPVGWAANPLVVLQQTEAGAVLLDTASGDCFELNRVGAEVWPLLAAGQEPDLIASTLANRYGISESKAQSDLGAVVGDLVRHGLLVRPRR
jgi:hypothetical protein